MRSFLSMILFVLPLLTSLALGCNESADFLSCTNAGNTATDMGYRLRGIYKLDSYTQLPPDVQRSFNEQAFTSSTMVRMDIEVSVPFTVPSYETFEQLYCRVRTESWSVVGKDSDNAQCGFDTCTGDDLNGCLIMSKELSMDLVYDRARWFLPFQRYDLNFPFDYMVFKRQTDYTFPLKDNNVPNRGCMTKAVSQSACPTNGLCYGSCNCVDESSGSQCCSEVRTKGTCSTDDPEERFQYVYGHPYCLRKSGDTYATYTCSNQNTWAGSSCPPCSNASTPNSSDYPNMEVFPSSWTPTGNVNRPLTPRDIYHSIATGHQACLSQGAGACLLPSRTGSLYQNWADARVTLCQAPPPLSIAGYQSDAVANGLRPPTLLDATLYDQLTEDTSNFWSIPETGSMTTPTPCGTAGSLAYAGLTCGFCYVADQHCRDGLSLAAQLFLSWGAAPICYSVKCDQSQQPGVGFDMSISISLPANVLNKTLLYSNNPVNQPQKNTLLSNNDSNGVVAGLMQLDQSVGQNAFFSDDLSQVFADLFGAVYCTNAYNGLTAEIAWDFEGKAPPSTSSKYIPIPGLSYRVFPFAQRGGVNQDDLCAGCTPLDLRINSTNSARLWYTLDANDYQQMVDPSSKCTGQQGELGRFSIGTDWYNQLAGSTYDPTNTKDPRVSACLSMPSNAQAPQMCRPMNQGPSYSPCGTATTFQQWTSDYPSLVDQLGAQTAHQNWLNYPAASNMPASYDNTIMPNVWLQGNPGQGIFVMYPPVAPGQDDPYTPQLILTSVYVNLTAYDISLSSAGTVYQLQVQTFVSNTNGNTLCPVVGPIPVQCTQPSTQSGIASCGRSTMIMTILGDHPSSLMVSYMMDVSDCAHQGLIPFSSIYTSGQPFNITAGKSLTVELFFSGDGTVTDDTTCDIQIMQLVGQFRPTVATVQPITCSSTKVQSPSPSPTPSHSQQPSKQWDGSQSPSPSASAATSSPRPVTTVNPPGAPDGTGLDHWGNSWIVGIVAMGLIVCLFVLVVACGAWLGGKCRGKDKTYGDVMKASKKRKQHVE